MKNEWLVTLTAGYYVMANDREEAIKEAIRQDIEIPNREYTAEEIR